MKWSFLQPSISASRAQSIDVVENACLYQRTDGSCTTPVTFTTAAQARQNLVQKTGQRRHGDKIAAGIARGNSGGAAIASQSHRCTSNGSTPPTVASAFVGLVTGHLRRVELLGQQVGSNTQTRSCQCCCYD
jgi:hypothetical protein